MKLIRSLFLVKEIVSKEGEVHFRRYRFLSLPWCNLYLHQILVSDYDAHFHDHPWHFRSLILKGSYKEAATYYPNHEVIRTREYKRWDIAKHHARDAHKLTLTSPVVWSLVFTWGRHRQWGYLHNGQWLENREYRALKNQGKL
jgi:hypothetical protein